MSGKWAAGLITLGLLLILAILLAFDRTHVRAPRALLKEVSRLRAEGAHLTPSPTPEGPVLPEENGVTVLAPLIKPGGRIEIFETRRLVDIGQLLRGAADAKTRQRVADRLAEADESLRLLAEGTSRPHWEFDYVSQAGDIADQGCLALACDAVLAAHDGDAQRSLRRIDQCLRLAAAAGSRAQFSYISIRIRTRSIQHGLQALERALELLPPETDFTSVLPHLDPKPYRKQWRLAILKERAGMLQSIEEDMGEAIDFAAAEDPWWRRMLPAGETYLRELFLYYDDLLKFVDRAESPFTVAPPESTWPRFDLDSMASYEIELEEELERLRQLLGKHSAARLSKKSDG